MGTTSQNGLRFTTANETRALKAYKDGNGIPTIGIGHTKNVKMGDVITNQQMNQYLKEDIAAAEAIVNAVVKGPLLPHQFDMLVDITFNAGGDFVNQGDVQAAIAGGADHAMGGLFQFWVSDEGVIQDGLLKRASMRARIYMQGYTPRNLAWISKHRV